MTSPMVTSMYSRLFMGLSDESNIGVSLLGYAAPLGTQGQWGSYGLGYWRLRLDSLFTEQSTSLSYSHLLQERPWGQLYAGTTLKLLQRSYGSTAETENAISLSGSALGSVDPVFSKSRSKSGVSLDLGLLYRISAYYSLGLAIQNVNEPNMALEAGAQDAVPMTLKLGGAFRVLGATFGADVTRRESIPGYVDQIVALGAERTWLMGSRDAISVRAGFESGSRDLQKATLGLGYQFSRLIMNYAFQMPLSGVSKTDGHHQLSLSFLFGSPADEEADIERMLRQSQGARIQAEQALTQAVSARLAAEEKVVSLTQEIGHLRAGLTTQSAVDEAERRKRVALEEERVAKEREEQARRQMEAAYKLSWSYYQRRSAGGAKASERIDLLEKIIIKYSGSGLDLKEAVRELAKLKMARAEVVKEFDASWDYYEQLATQEASQETRIELLQKIMEKYNGRDIDLSAVHQELEKLGVKP
ncbi:MAG: type IX secretion system membrane protein PorP/SprF [Elusimicrobia bacterium]|nr:type IX secretion system membrane protein PorP/SprF [Elusimicrobiota bacterium]